MKKATTDQEKSRIAAKEILNSRDKAELKTRLSREYRELMDIRLLIDSTLIRTKIDTITTLTASLSQADTLFELPIDKADLMVSMEKALLGEGNYQAFGILKNQVDQNVRAILPVWR